MTPTIVLARHIRFDLDGPVTILGTFTQDNTFTGVGAVTHRAEIVLAQPDPWETDTDLLNAIAALYPECDVSWSAP